MHGQHDGRADPAQPVPPDPQPYDRPPLEYVPDTGRAAMLADALRGVQLGAFDRTVVDWLAWHDTPTVSVIVGLLARCRAAGRRGPLGTTGRAGTAGSSPRDALARRLTHAADELAVATAEADALGIDPPAEIVDLAAAAAAWARRLDARPNGA